MGVGDHGGGVTKEAIKQVLEMQNDPSLPELRWSTVREFFTAVEQSPEFANLPVIRTELQHHARGCYAAHGEGKQQNRRAEQSLRQSETLSVIANINYGTAYPGNEYKAAWWKVLFNQFHDVMAGSAIYTDYADMRDSLGWACETAQTAKIEALETMAKRVDLRAVKEGAVFVFNPLPWRRKALLQYLTDVDPSKKGSPISCLETPEGKKTPLQWMPSVDLLTARWLQLCAWVDLPACGYRVFELAHGTPPEPEPHKDFFTISESGFGISSLQTADGKELLAGPINLVVIGDTSDAWGHGIDKFRREVGRPQFVSSDVVADGPVMRVTRQKAKWNNSSILLDIMQFRGLEFVELRFAIDWHEHEQILKLELPVAFASPRVFAKVPGAIITRQQDGGEEPYQDWLAVEGQIHSEDYSVGLINDSTYSYDCLGGLLRTVLVRSARFTSNPENFVSRSDDVVYQDQGRQERRFWLVCGKGPYTSLELDRLADELETPTEYVMDSAHEGTEPWERSFLSVTPPSVAVLAIKRSESGEGIIIRLQERTGKATEAAIEIPSLGIDHKFQLNSWEIKTVFVDLAKEQRPKFRLVSLLEK
jgi:alpha-mannosidase